ncbi:MAG: AAA family ATPase [Armatimonadota bacterium]
MSTAAELELAIRARVPLIAVVTPEEARAEERLFRPLAAKWREGRLLIWSATTGFNAVSSDPEAEPEHYPAPDPHSALDLIAGYEEPALFVLRDFHHYLENAALLRKLRDLARELPATGKQLVFLSPRFRVPDDLEQEIEVFDYPPPGLDELGELLGSLEADFAAQGEQAVALSPAGRERLLKAALGLTLAEAEIVLAKALVRDGVLTDAAVDLVLSEKKQIVRRGGLLEYYEAEAELEDVGGLKSLKTWLRRRVSAFTEDAREYGLPVPRGILLLGVQGCGKSLVAKATSREWKMPLLRLDVGRLFGKYIGESEAAVRRAIATAEAVAPSILWIDEIEKGFAGATHDAHDTGVSARVLGTFLTWMQEKRKAVFVVATANQVRTLPPELLRKGRFDELFFVDLPSPEERAEIFRVHLQRRRRDPAAFDLAELAERTEGFTGAEIEQIVHEALFAAYHEDRRPLRQEDLLAAAAHVIPLSVTMKESLTAMRNWAATRARRAS